MGAARYPAATSVVSPRHQETSANGDYGGPTRSSDQLQAAGRLREPGSGPSRSQRPGGIGENRDHGENEPEQQDLAWDLTRGSAYELWEDGGKEDDRLRVGDTYGEALRE